MSSDSGLGGSRLRLVTEVLRSFADATNDYPRLLETIVQRVGALLGHACSIRLLTEDGQKLATAAQFDPHGDPTFGKYANVPIPVTESLRNALEHQKAYFEKVTSQGIEEVHPDTAGKAMPTTHVIVAPLVARGAAMGCLFVVQRSIEATTVAPDDLELVDALAHHAALALANSRLLDSLEAVERARQHERSILDTVQAPLLLIDPEAKIIGVNRAFAQIFGVEKEEAEGQNLFAIADACFDVAAARQLFADLPPSRPNPEGVEIELATPTGVRTFLFRTKKTFRPGNGSETTLVTLVDLTDRLSAAKLARRQALLLASMAEALISLDRDFNIEDWNPAAERFFGYTAEETRGKPAADIFAVTTNNDREGNRQQLREGKTVRTQMRIQNRTNDWVDVEVSTHPIVEAGVVNGYVSVMLDATERVRLEGQLRARVEQLTDANRELEAFSYSVSHDLRAPIRAIDGFAELLQQDHGSTLDDEGKRLLGIVRKNAKRMGVLIDDLLALARFNRQPIVEEELDMEALARSVLDEAMRAEPQRKIAVSFGPLPSVRGDEGLLRQVWMNLYSNAVKYTRGRADAAIETSASEQSGEVFYTVKDNGAGFDMRHANKLFGTFERLHTAKEFEGTGIGLALVARIVDRHGGQVWGTGEVGCGATFVFSIPKARKEIS